jgi:hypothetical protein
MGQHRSVRWVAVIGLGLAILLTVPALAYSPPLLDLWTPAVLQRVRDRATLNPQIIPRLGYVEVFYDSEIGEAKWADSELPYEIHVSSKMHYQFAEMAFGTDSVPRFEHFPRCDFPVPTPPAPCD